jgi:hypothetical protein
MSVSLVLLQTVFLSFNQLQYMSLKLERQPRMCETGDSEIQKVAFQVDYAERVLAELSRVYNTFSVLALALTNTESSFYFIQSENTIFHVRVSGASQNNKEMGLWLGSLLPTKTT